MTWADVIRFAAHALRQHRRRSLLSLLGVVIGVVAVVSLTALGEGRAALRDGPVCVPREAGFW